MTTITGPKIGLTQFISYTLKTSSGQLSEVRKIKYQNEYNPAGDYYKNLREGIIKYHSEKKPLEFLYDLPNKVDPKKQPKYHALIKGYKRFLGRKDIVWFNPPKAIWSYEELVVRSSPELGLILNGQPYLIKLHFKDVAISKKASKDILTLMAHSSYDRELPHNIKFAILDIHKSKLLSTDDFKSDDLLILESHAHQFLYLWDKISYK